MSASAEASHITLNPKPCRMGAQQTCCGVRCDIVPHAAALSCRSFVARCFGVCLGGVQEALA